VMTGVLAGFVAAVAADVAAAAGADVAAAAGADVAAAGLVADGLGASVGLAAPAAGVAGTGGVEGAAQAASRATLVPRTVVSIDRRVSITDRGRMNLPPLHRRWPSTGGPRPGRRMV
jgi:hypothetical protein